MKCPRTNFPPPPWILPGSCLVRIVMIMFYKLWKTLFMFWYRLLPFGRPGLPVLTSLLVSVDVKIYGTMLRYWSQLVSQPTSEDIKQHYLSRCATRVTKTLDLVHGHALLHWRAVPCSVQALSTDAGAGQFMTDAYFLPLAPSLTGLLASVDFKL